MNLNIYSKNIIAYINKLFYSYNYIIFMELFTSKYYKYTDLFYLLFDILFVIFSLLIKHDFH